MSELTYDEQTAELRHVELMAAIISAGMLADPAVSLPFQYAPNCVLIAREIIKVNRER